MRFWWQGRLLQRWTETDCEAWCAACGEARIARFEAGVTPSVKHWLGVHRLLYCKAAFV